jgi:rare lipoprotein A
MLKNIILLIHIFLVSYSAYAYSISGMASWYGNQFNGRLSANGEIFNENKLTCASNIIPLNKYVKVCRINSKKCVTLKVTDTGNFNKYNRVLDVSREAARQLKFLEQGVVKVEVYYEN